MCILERLTKLFDEGNELINTADRDPIDGATILIPYSVDENKFAKWQSNVIVFLEKILLDDDFRLEKFKDEVKESYLYSVKIGMGIIESVMEDVKSDNLKPKNNNSSYCLEYQYIEDILNNFHKVAKQLLKRKQDRETLKINDEYDVQDLLHALLKIHFNDIRDEDPVPYHAGKSSRVDFLIKDCNTIIETKMARENLKDDKIGEELTIDIERYSEHPSLDKLYCFVYDPNEYVDNPIALESDLSKTNENFDVKVIVMPK